MHGTCDEFFKYAKEAFNAHMKGRALEVGCVDVNGSIRPGLEGLFDKYIGVDWRAGENVDVVSLAHEMEFDEPFDVIFSASMLEHDPHWEKSLERMVELLKPAGLMVLSWGNSRNPEHELHVAPDGGFHPLCESKVISLLTELGCSMAFFTVDELLTDGGTFSMTPGGVNAVFRKGWE